MVLASYVFATLVGSSLAGAGDGPYVLGVLRGSVLGGEGGAQLTFRPPAKLEYEYEETQVVEQRGRIAFGLQLRGTMVSSFSQQGAVWTETRVKTPIGVIRHNGSQWLPQVFFDEKEHVESGRLTYRNGLAGVTIEQKSGDQWKRRVLWLDLETVSIPAGQVLTKGAKWSSTVPAAELQAEMNTLYDGVMKSAVGAGAKMETTVADVVEGGKTVVLRRAFEFKETATGLAGQIRGAKVQNTHKVEVVLAIDTATGTLAGWQSSRVSDDGNGTKGVTLSQGQVKK